MTTHLRKRALSLQPEGSSSNKKQGSGINASVHDHSEGTTYNISGSSSVHYGASFITQNTYGSGDCLIHNLTRSHNAEYDMKIADPTRGPCTPDTRTTILQELLNWCNSDIALYWLSGMAGTGKTTIAYSACQKLVQSNQLGASFFCSRSLPDCRDVKLIIPTIAFQLARQFKPFSEALSNALHSDEYILKRDLDVQLRKLIIEPWLAKKDLLPDNAIVTIDALDECVEHHSEFLKVIFAHVTQLPFKLLMTSRPEPSIRDAMVKKARVSGKLSTFILHEVEGDLVREDIAKYLTSQLSPYLTLDDIQFLTDLAGTLFIFAATLVRFLTAKKVNIAMRIKLLRTSLPPDAKLKMLARLDELHKGVLTAAFHGDLMEMEVRGMREILFTIVFARTPMTRKAIASFWMLTEMEVEDRLDALRSVISVPDGHDRPITVFHASFLDFIENPIRSQQFCCDVRASNLELVWQCLALMKRELRSNLCRLNGRPANDTIHLDLIHQHISPGLQYASVYWLQHWMACDYHQSRVVLGSMQEFFTMHALQWFECLSLLRKLSVSTLSLEKLQHTIYENADLAGLVCDLSQLVRRLYYPVEYSAMEIYHSALTWIPICSPLRTRYASLCKQVPQVLYGLKATWTGLGQVINIPSNWITSIAVSQDGGFIISGSRDRTVRVWNVPSHVEESVFSGHTDSVISVAISGDGSRAVSGSDDESMRVWNVATREVIFILNVFGVRTVAISLDGKWIASGQSHGPVCVWDATNGRLIHSFEERIWSEPSFTHDGIRLFSSSAIKTVRLRSATAGDAECILHTVVSSRRQIVCSPNNDKIATIAYDGSACLWDIPGTLLHVLRAHSDRVNSVAFTPDGKQLVTGSEDKTIRIWDVTSGHTIQVFTALEPVHLVSVFPDGTKIASYSHGAISIWNLRGENDFTGIGERSDNGSLLQVAPMGFSANGQRVLLKPSLRILDVATLEEKINLGSTDGCIALSTSGERAAAVVLRYESGEDDEYYGDDKYAIEIWELTENDVRNHLTLIGHAARIRSISFSHDEHQLVSTSDDCTARIWNTATGQQIHVLQHHTGVHCAAFSYDNAQIVSRTYNATHIWNVQSGMLLLHKFGAYNQFATFSADDQYIIMSSVYVWTVKICNSKTLESDYIYEGYRYWTQVKDGSFFALSEDGWIYRFPCLGGHPHRLLWIPLQYRPTYFIDGTYEPFASGPLFTPISRGVQVRLPQKDGLVTLLIPHGAY